MAAHGRPAEALSWRLGPRRLPHGAPLIVGIVNVTPDSFSDGGRHLVADDAVAWAERLWSDGADWLDVGGESTRPHAQAVDADTELARVVPVIAAVHAKIPQAVISIDTRHAVVADAALQAGASVVNDVSAGDDALMGEIVAKHGAGWVLMHHRGIPVCGEVASDDIVKEVYDWLGVRVERAMRHGVDKSHLLVDPGIGFGKTHADNIALISASDQLAALGCAVLVGASRKRVIGTLTDVHPAAERVFGSVGAACAAARGGAHMIRVHDVAATISTLRVYLACDGR